MGDLEMSRHGVNPISRTRPSLLYCIISACLLSLFAFGSSAFAWYAQTHYQMTLAAYNSLPQEVRDKIPRKTLLDASNEPDGTAFDPEGSYSSFKPENKDYYHGDPRYVKDLTDKLLKALQQDYQDWNAIALLMGQLAHHIQDLNQPYHAAMVLPSGHSEKDLPCHEQFEDRAKFWMSAEFRTVSGSASYRPEANDIGQRALRYLSHVRPAKCVGVSDPESCCRDHAVPSWVFKELAENSVRDTAGYWTSIFDRALQPAVPQTSPNRSCEGAHNCGDYCCPTSEVCSYSNDACEEVARRLGGRQSYDSCKRDSGCWKSRH